MAATDFAGGAEVAGATPCTRADFAAAVDRSGAQLREFNMDAGPALQERMRRYAEAAKISEDRAEDAAFEAIQDEKMLALDEQSAGLLLKIDSLGRVEQNAAPDCGKLDEIKTASAVLLAVMRQKSDYMLARLDARIAEADEKTLAAAPKDAPNVNPPEKASPAPVDRPKAEAAPAPAKPVAAVPTSPQPGTWAADAKPNDAYAPLPEVAITDATPTPPAPQSEVGYSIDEIRDATRGFFGSVSTNLASVIEHAFKTSGRPTAYVLGTEGGGAFLAGLRFGKGTLYLRDQQETRQVYWHGPSVGTDFGASGSRTMFLIYKLRDANALYRSFTGIDGSAYFVGGVGVTLLKGGEVIMAPIRSGLGLRFGANIGYVRFTDSPTWNPF
ncbi:MAG: DUF1134 domain-containing protein [Hyphomicrobium sp.]